MKKDEILLKIIEKREIPQDEIEEFLSVKPKKTYSPYLLKDLKEGVDLIIDEINNGSKICIYGDYDADGITSTALMLSILREIIPEEQWNKRLGYYIPSRFDEGYGLNTEAIDVIHSRGYNFIITVDCGSVSYEEVEYAKFLGIKVLVTDHHKVTDKKADCLLINPNQPGDEYPFKSLSGCGVAFKVAQGLRDKCNLNNSALSKLLDLVAIGTIGDVMPLIDENRTFVKYGLRVINEGNRIGLKTLIENKRLKLGNITSENISFIIVPNINAAGRMERATLAVKVLDFDGKNNDYSKCLELVRELMDKNEERKALQEILFVRAVKKLEETGIPGFITIYIEDAHEGITGIVAGKIKEKFNRPTLILTDTERNKLKATGRSIEGINLYEMLKKYENLFDKFGGHKGACGFTMSRDNLQTLQEGLNKDIGEIHRENENLFERELNWDLKIKIEDANLELIESLKLLEPYGAGNPKPVFAIGEGEIYDIRFMGKNGEHLKFQLRDKLENPLTLNPKIQCLLFNEGQDYTRDFLMENQFTVVGNLGVNHWQGVDSPELLIKEIQFDGIKG